MNERIKELIEQATSNISVDHEGYRGKGYTEQVEYFDKEKFAELIVRECARSVAWYTKEERNWPNNGRVIRANKTVLEHFGVD